MGSSDIANFYLNVPRECALHEELRALVDEFIVQKILSKKQKKDTFFDFFYFSQKEESCLCEFFTKIFRG